MVEDLEKSIPLISSTLLRMNGTNGIKILVNKLG